LPTKRWHPDVVLPGERPRIAETPAVPADALERLDDEQRAALPNLIGIGAPKCGTSALYAYLAAHPEIGMAAVKELKHFGSRHWIDGLADYAARFDAGKPVRGEVSPTYAIDPFVPNVPEQMAAVLPDPRFVYMVGDPVARVVAHWGEARALTYDRRPLEEALADADDPLNPYVAASRFAHQLGRFREVFGAERILVVDQRDLRERRRETLREIFAFAGVDPGHWSPVFDAEPNAASSKLQPNRLGQWIVDRTSLPRGLRRRAIVRGITAEPLRRAQLTSDLRARLEEILAPDAARLRELTGRDFAHWSV
jgi:hypothetical protein